MSPQNLFEPEKKKSKEALVFQFTYEASDRLVVFSQAHPSLATLLRIERREVHAEKIKQHLKS